MTDDNEIRARVRRLLDEPDRHDPAAFKQLLDDTEGRFKTLQGQLDKANGIIHTAKKLLTEHASHCAVAAGILCGIQVAEGIETYIGEHAVKDDKFYSRLRGETSGNVLLGPFGPFDTQEEAQAALDEAMANMPSAMPEMKIVSVQRLEDMPSAIAEALGINTGRPPTSGTMH